MAFEILACYIENIDEHFNILEDMFPLALEKLLHKEVLSSTIPKRQNQVAKKSDARFGYVYGKRDSVSIPGKIVSKDN